MSKSEIITQLKKEILSLEGLGSLNAGSTLDLGLGFLEESLPNGHFPLGAVHEMISEGKEGTASTAGFIIALLSGLMKKQSPAVWIGHSPLIFPPALKNFGIRPDQLIFICLQKEKEILWAMQEALKCPSLAAVIGEIPGLSFTHSRRFQLAVEQSKTTGFILRSNPGMLTPNSCVARWRIKPLPGMTEEGLPGLSYPRWKVELLKIRNGRPADWEVEWTNGRFHPVSKEGPSIYLHPKRKTG